LILIENVIRNVNRLCPSATEGCIVTCVTVSVIFMFPGVMAGRQACCDVACRVSVELWRRILNYHTIETSQPRHGHTRPPQPEQLEHFQKNSHK